MYDARLEAFCNFYRSFYGGHRVYSLAPTDQLDIFDYPEFAITFGTFCSCYNNDPYHKEAQFTRIVLRRWKALRHFRYADRLLLAVWHHNTAGGPSESDYMDADTLQPLIDTGFSIGLHGHQHKPQFIEERFLFGEARKVTIVGRGTLCAVAPNSRPAKPVRTISLRSTELV